MKMSPIFTQILLFSIIIISANENLCPNKCICRKVNQRDEIRLRCGGNKNKINNFEEIDLLNIANDIVQFNLSNNLLDTFFPKVQLVALQKLDLSGNKLTELQNNQFSELPNLLRLDLSNNNIKIIEPLAFAKLTNLERLKLNQNQISTIVSETFNPLVSLKQLDISNNPLTCDCSLLWLLGWSQKESVKLVSNPTCNTPTTFSGLLLRKLKIGVDIHCKSPALNNGFPIIEMQPSSNQVVFEGDSLYFQCTAPSISDTYDSPKIDWTWLDSDPKLYFSDVIIESHFLQSTGLVVSTLLIPKLSRNHTGFWNCVLDSKYRNDSKGVMIVVISDDTQYCPITTTMDNKGSYTWPRTVTNFTATIPCESQNLNYDSTVQKAFYFCSEDGHWENLNTSMCSYTSETTKILEQFSKVNSSIVESAKHFRNYTSTPKHFRDIMDIVFAVKTMENYLKYLTVNQIGGVLMDVANNLLQLPKQYLRKANYKYGSCAKLVNITERLAETSSTALLHKTNMAVEMFPVKKSAFSNLRCTWYIDIDKPTERLFYCVADSETAITELPGKIMEASITIPETLFEQLVDQEYQLPDKIYNILISMYSSNKFFPISSPRVGKVDVTSAVVGVKLVDFSVSNLTEPVFIMLKTPETNIPLVPVWWNNDTWLTDGCEFSHEYDNHIGFFCHNFGHYGLLQDVTSEKISSAKFRLCHPAIYIGSVLLVACFLVTIVTYLMAYSSIQMPKKGKHSLINLWIAVCFLVFFYVFGIYQTEDLRVCQIVGMLLHYFSLSSLLWMCVGVNCMYKRLSKSDVIELQDDELPSDQPIKKPILGLYFVGWGVAIIVCGISAAINIKEYSSPSYCFLKMGPPLSALYIPVAILLLFLSIFFLLIRCAIYSLDSNGHLSEGTQATENVDLDLLEPNFSPETRSVLTTSSKTASSEMEDPEHAPASQLKAYIIFLTLYILSWLSCAFATVEPYFFVSFETDLASILFAVFSTVLGAFTVFFYCFARSDVRGQWVIFCRYLKRRQLCFRTRNISDTSQNQIQIQHLPVPPVTNSDLQVTSRSSSRSSGRTKSNASNVLKGADLNAPSYSDSRSNNVNLIMLHRQQYRTSVIPNIIENPTNAAEVFYNPHQSIVARKFFKRQKRHLMKRNNLVCRQRDSDSTSVVSDLRKVSSGIKSGVNLNVDQNIFGTSSKVNNTNIHVERQIHKRKQKNPNIFSDSGDDYDQNIVLNAELLRKNRRKKLNANRAQCIENEMRSVSQQCTLEYSSENISDSILDKSSPDKDCQTGESFSKIEETSAAPGASMTLEPVPTIYVNPSHDLMQKRVQSRASSVSVSDLDDLYQQIRRGPRSHLNSFSLTRNSPCFSDSDITDQMYRTRVSTSNVSDDVETTV